MARLLLHRGGSKFEALDYPDDDPARFEHREVDSAQALRWRDEGGFRIASPEEFNERLKAVSSASRKARRAAMPTEAVLRRANPEGSSYEALEYSKANPRQATRTTLAPQQLARWRDDGGFEEVPEPVWREHLNRSRGVETAESNLRVAPDFTLEEEVPGVRENIAPALDVRASESTSYERPAAGDEEYRRAVAESDTQRTYRGLQRAGADLLKTFTGVDYDPKRFEEDPETNPVKRLLMQREMDRKSRLSDPNSPESKRLQSAVQAAMPGAYTPEQLATIAAEDEPYITDFVKVRSAAEQRAAAAAEAAKRAKERQDFDAEQQRLSREATIRAAGITAAGKRSDAEADRAQKKELAELEAGQRNFKAEGDLRKELQGNKVYKEYEDAQVAFDKVKAAAADPNAQSDIALIYAVMKVFDPGSVVKETEFATAANAGGVPERIWNQFNRVKSGERLSREQRAEFVRVAEGQLGAYRRAYERLAEGYKGLATGAGVDPSRVVLPRQAAPTSTAPAALPPPAILPNGKRARRVTMPDGSIYEETADGGTKRIK